MTSQRRLRTARQRIGALDTRTASAGPKRADPHYLTPEHRAWAEAVIARSGRQCQDPQHDPARPRHGVRLFADHVRELRDGGAPFDPANGMARCGACHSRKTAAERAARTKESAKSKG